MKLKYTFILASALFLSSCNDAFLERNPQSFNDGTFWSSVNDLKTYANAFYGILPGGVTNLGDEDSDNQIPFNPNSFLWGQYTVPAEGGSWSKSNWSNIRNLNYFMTHYGNVQASENEVNPYVAEIRFFRALEYYAKIQTFGDVPWLEAELNVDSEELFGKKNPRNEVAKKIIEDLEFAIEWLPAKGSEEPNRLNKDIAKHVLGRVCLNEGTYYKYHTELGYSADVQGLLQKAANITDEIISSGKYDIYSTGNFNEDYYNMFIMEDKSNLKEAILYIDYEENLRYHNATRWLRNAKSGWSKDFVDCILYTDGKPASVTSKEAVQNRTMAEEAKDFPSRVDANDECFLSPDNMTEEVKDYCRRTGQKVPETMGEIATVIYTSLAECYAKTAKELEEMTGRTYSRIHIVGGGSNAGYLNELTAKATKKEIHAGPGEATAIGNITAQMLKAEEFKTIEEARTIIHESFGVKVYKE